MESLNKSNEFKILFKNNEEAANKLMNFIINKLLENDDIFKEIISESKNSRERRNSREHG